MMNRFRKDQLEGVLVAEGESENKFTDSTSLLLIDDVPDQGLELFSARNRGVVKDGPLACAVREVAS